MSDPFDIEDIEFIDAHLPSFLDEDDTELSLSQSLIVRRVEADTFEVLEPVSCSCGRIRYRDVIRMRERDDGSYEFVETIRRSRMRSKSVILPHGVWGTPEMEALLKRVEGAGGQWESWVRGHLHVDLPKGSNLLDHFDAELASVIQAVLSMQGPTNTPPTPD